ncbi:Excinuclease ABC subunit C [Limihaloglobus sulfuriphilus]|uniref:Excinuclease ABC subunit C n=1 Tax=Limihaloglobus sulfuriphilus TaxID=1851148 RepID=A0A1Q2MER5_9BACT|nr:excinuclease ABC subunit UvrC [Limihaloglobus sulfuriphilus]AQQ71160.1 Excinuclease ABC subunit C [Limihaloglobus sulfuriphilus]
MSSEKLTDKDRFAAIREQLKGLPAGPGLYFFRDSRDTVLYIGKAANIRSRASSYFQASADLMSSRGPKIVEMVAKTARVTCLETANEVEAILQEARLIKDIRPPYNTNLKDDKTFPYIEITSSNDFPGVYVTRQPRSKGSILFGPFAGAGSLQNVIVALQKIFRFRTCRLEILAKDDKRRFFRPCILHSIKQCTAPCGDRISREDYRKIIRDLTRFMRAKRSGYIRKVENEMQSAASELNYERAAVLRDRIKAIKRLELRGTVESNVQPEVFVQDPAAANVAMQKLLGSETAIRTIEGFDIAHISGQDTVGSLVKFIDGRPFKSGYRRFKIKTVRGIDDYESLREVLRRRYRHAAQGDELWPDVVLIDGGLGQLHAIEEVFSMFDGPKPHLLSLAKKEELVYISGRDDNPVRLKANSPARKLLQYVRDEAHRFAQHYHHILRSKRFTGKG